MAEAVEMHAVASNLRRRGIGWHSEFGRGQLTYSSALMSLFVVFFCVGLAEASLSAREVLLQKFPVECPGLLVESPSFFAS